MVEKSEEIQGGTIASRADTHEPQQAIEQLRQELGAILEALAGQLAADVVTLFLYDADSGEFDLPIGYGLSDADTFTHPRMRPRMDRVAGKIIRERQSVIADQVAGHPIMDGAFAHRERIASSAGFLLSHADEPLGVLFVSYRSEHTFSADEQQTIHAAAQRAAAGVARSDIFPILRQSRPVPQAEEEQTLQAIVSLACSVMNMPTSIWLLEPRSQSPRIRAATGLTHRYIAEAAATSGDDSLVGQVLQTREPQTIHDVRVDPRFRYPEHARMAGWVSSLGFPITFRGRTSGVIEVFTFEAHHFDQAELDILRHLADMASVAIESAYRSRESQKLAQVAHMLSAAPDFGRAMQVIVESARELTGADSSTIFILEKRAQRFIVGAHTPARTTPAVSLPRPERGLARQIIETGAATRIDDITQDAGVREDLLREGVRSLIGVRVQMAEEHIGVLYVNGRRKAQFTEYDVELLQMLADQASVALGWARLLRKPSDEIEQATSDLFCLEAILDRVCDEIQSSLGFEFATVQLIRPEEQIIETVHGTGAVGQWAGLVKHFLELNPDLRDIQADIALTKRTELIAGWDERFDRWVYEEYHHERLVRVFTPIVLVRDANGKVIDDWFEHCRWEVVAEEQSEAGRRIAIAMRLEDARLEGHDPVEVIGTVEAGYLASQAAIGVEEAIALARLVARQALDIHRALLPYVLEVIVERVRQIIGADSATLHFLSRPYQRRYVYQVGVGSKGQRLLRTNPLRKGGLGHQAIQAREPRYIPDPTQSHQDLKRLNETIFEQGIRAIAAFPLIIGEKEGVLYVYFEHEHRFTQDEIGWAQLLANRAVDAIRHATTYTQIRDRARQLTTLHSIAHNLVTRPEETSLLRYIAGSALNILAADLVTINEYAESNRRFSTPPDIAGRLINQENIVTGIDQHSAPTLLVERGTNIYEQQSAVNPILNDFSRPRMSGKNASFVIREKIASSAGILLKVSEEIVGVMFINYRRRHSFSEEEQRIIETLASSAAIAIKNRRLLSLSAVDREIITTLDLGELLNLIVQRAVGITGADLGDIRLLDSVTRKLVVQAMHPADAPIASTRTHIRVGEGIIGQAAARRESLLMNNVPSDARHKPYFPNVGSVLCVPLLDRAGHVLGVLTVGSNRLGAFNQRYQRMLEALANQAVIAIQNAENQQRLVKARTMATLGDFAGLVVHKMQDDFSAIRVRAREIQRIDGDDARKKELAAEIESLAAKVLQQTQILVREIPENLRAADLHGMISNALEQIDIPVNIVRQVDFSETLLHVLGNEEQLTDVFTNLIRNAMEAMPSGGTLSIDSKSIEQEGRYWVVVRVRDTGVGISEENLEHIFKRGYSTKGGLGVGLWLSQAYIEQLEGQITVRSKIGKGTEFTVNLPAFKPQV